MEHGRKREELDYFNAVCCLLTILIHVLSFGIVGLDKRSWQLACIYFPWQLSTFVVPAFLFCGAVKLSLQIKSGSLPPYGKYLLGRVRKVYLPYVVANVIYFIAFSGLKMIEPPFKGFFGYLLIGNLAAPFYYIVIVMQFYLLMPVWKQLVLRVSWYTAISCSAVITLLMLGATNVLTKLGIDFPYSDRIFATYLLFWVLGLYMGASYDELCADALRGRRQVWLAVPLVLVFAAIAYLQYTRGVSFYNTGFIKPFTDLLSILIVLTLSLTLAHSGRERLKGLLRAIHASSLFVFLSHCLFLDVGTFVVYRHGVTQMEHLLAVRGLISYTLPFLTYFIWKRAKDALKQKKLAAKQR